MAFLYRVSSFISRWIQNRTLFYIFKYLIYPTLIRRSRFFDPLSPLHAIMISVYWLGTAACNVVGARTITQVGKRAGALATLHLIPLFFANRMSLVADLLGISLQTYLRLHKSIGIMALLQSLIHTSIYLSQHTVNLKDHMQFYGFLVSKIAIESVISCLSISLGCCRFCFTTAPVLFPIVIFRVLPENSPCNSVAYRILYLAALVHQYKIFKNLYYYRRKHLRPNDDSAIFKACPAKLHLETTLWDYPSDTSQRFHTCPSHCSSTMEGTCRRIRISLDARRKLLVSLPEPSFHDQLVG